MNKNTAFPHQLDSLDGAALDQAALEAVSGGLLTMVIIGWVVGGILMEAVLGSKEAH